MNSSLLVFGRDYPVLILILAGLLLIILVGREWIREDKRRRLWRSLVAILLCVSILGIIYEPALRQSLGKSSLIYLSNNYDPDQFDSLRRRLPRAEVLVADSLGNLRYPDLDGYGSIFILGQGIPEYDLWQFEGRSVKFLPQEDFEGIIKLNAPKQIEQDRAIKILGKYLTTEPSERLFLNGPEGKLDSTTVGADNGDFEMTFVPKVTGNFIYTITNQNGLTERLPVIVKKGKKLKVLLINSFPTFETRNLKNFLAKKGHEVVVRNQVSKDAYRYEFYNTQERRISALSSDELSAQDLLIIDWQSLQALTNRETRLLSAAISEEGLGLFIQPEEAVFNSNRWIDLNRERSDQEQVAIQLTSNASVVPQYGYTLNLKGYQFSLLKDVGENTLAIAQRQGLGKIGTTVLRDIYRQNLTGDSLVYAGIWTELLNGLSKEHNEGASSNLGNEINYPFEPLNFEVQYPGSGVRVSVNGQPIPLQQNVQIPERWEGTFWPRTSGWNQIQTQKDTASFFVHDPSDWQARSAYQRAQANQNFFANQVVTDRSALFQYKPISKLWFFVLFLLSAGFLWLEPKV